MSQTSANVEIFISANFSIERPEYSSFFYVSAVEGCGSGVAANFVGFTQWPTPSRATHPQEFADIQASSNMASKTPHLPEELHRMIAQSFHRDDLANYRLASKLFCAIGTEELFQTITFHYSPSSIERLMNIGASDRLRQHVKTILWDTNLWKIPDVRDFHEWMRYFSKKAEFFRRHYESSTPEGMHAVNLSSLQISGKSGRRTWTKCKMSVNLNTR
ncbi:hypothetical protein EJ02DRAFT_455283 [Clathrospora elynae]|uniref:F-box domain-containing protein n=1 Tax=Clathrospora elynae TaxID=706981 RepID=A0A6A5SNX0_9PLEO|nr:hypothetical protein EJ02DRAFT_455283 [Clathrospora elynae]